MIDYQISIDSENGKYIVSGPFNPGSTAVVIPQTDSNRKDFVDFFLHKADIERGIDFLRCISIDKDNMVNEGLFIAGLNNCIKCFKYSDARNKLDKNLAFSSNVGVYDLFIEFEKLRDKHYNHDENGMVQATAFLIVSNNDELVFGGPPSVVWNREALNYYIEGQKLQGVAQHIWQFICTEIDRISDLIQATYRDYSKEILLELQIPQLITASSKSERK